MLAAANETGWTDPTVLFDDDGQVYLVHALADKLSCIDCICTE